MSPMFMHRLLFKKRLRQRLPTWSCSTRLCVVPHGSVLKCAQSSERSVPPLVASARVRPSRPNQAGSSKLSFQGVANSSSKLRMMYSRALHGVFFIEVGVLHGLWATHSRCG